MNFSEDIICDLIAEVRAELGEQAVSREISERIEMRIRYRWRGQLIYIQKREGDPRTRAQAVRSEYNGRNRIELQQKYEISRAQFYKIMKGG